MNHRTPSPARLVAVLGAVLAAACATQSEEAPPAPHVAGAARVFVVVRHAEKSDDDARDPSLSDAGHARARRLAARFDASGLDAAYATAYRRTRQTVAPAAQAHGIEVSPYDAGLPAADFTQALLAAHPGGTVLVAGHSNTVPGIVAALCGCDSAPMREDEFDRVSIVRIGADGRRALQVEHDAAGPVR
jgi:broad specificity phosphatase PhoE